MTTIFDASNYGNLCKHVYKNGTPYSPRGKSTRELLNVQIVCTNPRHRLITNPTRKLNRKFALGEFLALVLGISDYKYFTKLMKSFRRFSTDGKHIDPGTAYGPRLAGTWSQVVDILRQDQDSRQAVIAVYHNSEDIDRKYNCTPPCTLSFQFLIRDDKLHMITNMRSNDVWCGLPYDFFVYTMVQEYIANMLDVEIGNYYHNAASLHIYDCDVPKMLSMQEHDEQPMPPMPTYLKDIHLRYIADALVDDQHSAIIPYFANIFA